MLLPESSCVYIESFRSVVPRVFLAKIPFLAFSCYYDNHFPDFFSPCLSSCQISEKSTYWFGQNDGTNMQTDTQTSPFKYI